ncbi:LPS-assembly protein LptD [Coralliovum pocilloporae]|uniref:LPS-assembly protein LptD n=1 Tax=Coralliovum pocilloporae TaxID=3066369 RepID=UPI0033072125
MSLLCTVRRENTTRQAKRLRRLLLASVCLFAFPLAELAQAQTIADKVSSIDVKQDAPLLVEADELTYDFDKGEVIAEGNVQVYYEDNSLRSQKLVYNQKTGRLIASGDVTLIQPDGNIIRASQIDVTQDFSEGFVAALQLETPDRIHFASERAERQPDGSVVFHNGVYDACASCVKDSNKRSVWQIKARKIIYNQESQLIEYDDAKFEFLGVPVAYLPYFAHPDPSSERRSGFLTPTLRQRDNLGFGISVPYYFALAPDYDLTVTPTYYSDQGLLAQAEWRHKILDGAYSIRASGIFQRDPEAFLGQSGDRDFRGSIETDGRFNINDNWVWGWQGYVDTDRDFGEDYGLVPSLSQDIASELYLSGLGERNFFDLRAYHFRTFNSTDNQDTLPVVHPVLDYNVIFDQPVFGGELSYDVNFTSLTRQDPETFVAGGTTFSPGIEGTTSRGTVQGNWQKQLIAPGGLLIKPFVNARGDLAYVNSETSAPALIEDDQAVTRGMIAGGFEASWPILVASQSVTQVFEPVAQIIVRPDSNNFSSIPNEDAQSLVFDDTNLFSLNKFSGYDRIEGGTRANVGLKYTAQFQSGYALRAVIGQSYHLAGDNPFDNQDIVQNTIGSGLEDDVSDIVAGASITSKHGIGAAAHIRYDQDAREVRRGEVNINGAYGPIAAAVGYTYFDERNSVNVTGVRSEISGSLAVQMTDYWRAFGGIRFDADLGEVVSGNVGLAYDDESFSMSVTYGENRQLFTDQNVEQTILLRMQFRTLGELSTNQSLDN